MAKSGIGHADVGDELSKAEWLSEESHALVHGNAFPDLPVERQLFYRDDLHAWYIRTNLDWVSLKTVSSEIDHGSVLGLADDDHTQYLNVARHDVVARHPLSVLDSAVCSETEADSKITTHKGDASAHHSKTGNNEVYGLLQQGLAADKPVAAIAGRLYYSTDTGILERDTGTAWEEKARGETAIRLAQLSEKSHISLTDITANQHHNQSHDHSLAADGSPIAVAGVPNLDTSKITSGRFVLARLPDGTAGYFLKAAGAGVDPAFAALAAGDIASGRLVLARLPDGTSGYFLKAGGAGIDPAYALLVDADIPATIARDAEVDTKVSDHAALATGIHAVGTNFVAQAPAASHLVRTFTKGWTLNKLVKGAGADVDPTEEEMNQSCRAEHLAMQLIPKDAWTTLSFSSEASVVSAG